MNKKYPTILILLTLIIISACGPAPTPTIGVLDLQNTAIALAWTEVSMTQAALPTATATPIPPTPTLTFTPFPSPTFQPLVIAPTATSSVNPCNLPIPIPVYGTKTNVKFVNESKGIVQLSFGMTQKNELGECGTYNFNMGPSESPTKEVLTGCYWAYANIDVIGKKTSTARSTDYICLDYSTTRGVTITSEWIGLD